MRMLAFAPQHSSSPGFLLLQLQPCEGLRSFVGPLAQTRGRCVFGLLPSALLVSLQVPNPGVRGRRSVAVVELPAFPGTIKAFPACVFTWQPWQTVNTKATVKTYGRGVIYALSRSRSSSDTAARNTWKRAAWAPSCRAHELFYT